MEPLSAVASGMAVVSLSLQLVQSTKAITTFLRDIKQAPTELTRLTESLERFTGILEDVHQILEEQESKVKISPPASMFKSLNACKTHLRPLKDIVDRYATSSHGYSSKRSRLWKDLKLGLKAKEISVFEDKIERDMVALNIAMSTNLQRVQLHTIQIVSACKTQVIPRNIQPKLTLEPESTIRSSNSPMSYDIKSARREIALPSILNSIGIRHKKIVHSLHQYEDGKRGNENADVDMFEEYVYTWNSRFWKLSIQWSTRRSYGNILPSLNTCPIVEDFNRETINLIRNGSICEIQRAFHTGTVHPRTENVDGINLLHFAALYNRADLCLYLSELQIEPNSARDFPLAFTWAIKTFSIDSDSGAHVKTINTVRIILREFEVNVNNETITCLLDSILNIRLDVIDWLWVNASSFLIGDDIHPFNDFCVHSYIGLLTSGAFSSQMATEKLYPLMCRDVNGFLKKYGVSLIWQQWDFTEDQHRSTYSRCGSREGLECWLRLLAQLGIDIGDYFEKISGRFRQAIWTTRWAPTLHFRSDGT